jgi:hypothetical protein
VFRFSMCRLSMCRLSMCRFSLYRFSMCRSRCPAGAHGPSTIVIPSHDLVIVRRGLDGSVPGFPTWDLLKEVLKGLPEREGGKKPGT